MVRLRSSWALRCHIPTIIGLHNQWQWQWQWQWKLSQEIVDNIREEILALVNQF